MAGNGRPSGRVTCRNSRRGSAKHNVRFFALEKAKHIDAERTINNVYWFWDQDEQIGPDEDLSRMEYAERFSGCELRFYQQRFREALDEQNERHVKARNYSRIKTMEDWVNGPNTRCEETVLQIGNRHTEVDPADLVAAVGQLLRFMDEWSRDHGEPFAVLDVAGHMDEGSYHVQLRRVWQYRDERGVWKIGQNKALEAAGVPLPDPAQPSGKFNNRKMTFDAMIRAKWIEICRSFGYEANPVSVAKETGRKQIHVPLEQFQALEDARAEIERERASLEQEKAAFREEKAHVQTMQATMTAQQQAQRPDAWQGFGKREQRVKAAERQLGE